jgi:hypothetical protein
LDAVCVPVSYVPLVSVEAPVCHVLVQGRSPHQPASLTVTPDSDSER